MYRMAGCLAATICLAVFLASTAVEARPRLFKRLCASRRFSTKWNGRAATICATKTRDDSATSIAGSKTKSSWVRSPKEQAPTGDSVIAKVSEQPEATKDRPHEEKVEPKPPFADARLSAKEQAAVAEALQQWEAKTKKIQTLDVKFTRWEYDSRVFEDPQQPTTVSKGEIKYAQPDKWRYRILESTHFLPPVPGQQALQEELEEGGEYWTCDGTAIYEYRQDVREVHKRPLPPDLAGMQFMDKHLPFVFGVEAEELAARFFIQIVTPPGANEELWLEFYPRTIEDWREYDHVAVILSKASMLLTALEITRPKDPNAPDFSVRKSYEFVKPKINDPQITSTTGCVFFNPREEWRVIERETSGVRQRVMPPAAPPRR